MRLEARGPSSALRLFARVTIASSIGGIVFAVCVIPNANNEKFHRWIPALALVSFSGPIATALACRFCVDESAAYNDGYNDALNRISKAKPDEVQYVPTPVMQQNLPILSPDPAKTPAVRPTFSSINARDLVPDGDEFAFLDATP